AAEAIHGDKSQNARLRTLANLKSGRTHVLVATDLAARGIDVAGISHVFNYDLPPEPETYLHRIGRTGRAGAQGEAIAFCSQDDRQHLRAVERLLGRKINVRDDVPFGMSIAEQPPRGEASAQPKSGDKNRSRRRFQGRPQAKSPHSGGPAGRKGPPTAKAAAGGKPPRGRFGKRGAKRNGRPQASGKA
ncbi:MAG: DEAD/DEAH box helicase, partial [Planctomycetales bacterium]|nr:DEAD/DEAH box helicase [Planctomycetales bacterium]